MTRKRRDRVKADRYVQLFDWFSQIQILDNTQQHKQSQHQHTMFGKHTNTVLALAAFVSLGVLMPDMSGTTRNLSAEQEVR